MCVSLKPVVSVFASEMAQTKKKHFMMIQVFPSVAAASENPYKNTHCVHRHSRMIMDLPLLKEHMIISTEGVKIIL